MAISSKSKAGQQPVLAANVTRIVAELHQLAASARVPEADHQARSGGASAMVIRGK
jgi:hypothetical protein